MPRFDGTGPRGEGAFTGRGEGYCALRLPEPGSGEPAVGYAGIAGRPVRLAPDAQPPLVSAGASAPAPMLAQFARQGRCCRYGQHRCESQRFAAR